MKCICNSVACTGCRACFHACKENNIELITGFDGFKYAKAKQKCESCGFVCPVYKKNNEDYEKTEVYAVQTFDSETLVKSTSGGMFSILADYVLEKGGVVFGAVYDENMKVCHIAAKTKSEIEGMRGSKYVQSDVGDTYKQAESYLQNGDYVLYTGLPCQIAGLNSYLSKQYDNLITVDLICSGVPSPLLFENYLNVLKQGKYKRITDFKFRDKQKHGFSHTVVIKYIDKNGRPKVKTIKKHDNVSYYLAFGKLCCLMKACYKCKYRNLARVSDFTIGDFWSLRFTGIKLDEKKGVSLVLANTDKARNLMDFVKTRGHVVKSEIKYAYIKNDPLIKNPPVFVDRDKLYEVLNEKGYKEACRRYFKPKKFKWLRRLVPKNIKTSLKRVLKQSG